MSLGSAPTECFNRSAPSFLPKPPRSSCALLPLPATSVTALPSRRPPLSVPWSGLSAVYFGCPGLRGGVETRTAQSGCSRVTPTCCAVPARGSRVAPRGGGRLSCGCGARLWRGPGRREGLVPGARPSLQPLSPRWLIAGSGTGSGHAESVRPRARPCAHTDHAGRTTERLCSFPRARLVGKRVCAESRVATKPVPADVQISLLCFLACRLPLCRMLCTFCPCLSPSLGFPLSEAGTSVCIVTCTLQLPRTELARSRSHRVRELKGAREAGGTHAGAGGLAPLPVA